MASQFLDCSWQRGQKLSFCLHVVITWSEHGEYLTYTRWKACVTISCLLVPPFRFVEDQINIGVYNYKSWQDLGGEKVVHLQVGQQLHLREKHEKASRRISVMHIHDFDGA